MFDLQNRMATFLLSKCKCFAATTFEHVRQLTTVMTVHR